MYCEDAPADEVEHFQPKDLYPEFVFSLEELPLRLRPVQWAEE